MKNTSHGGIRIEFLLDEQNAEADFEKISLVKSEIVYSDDYKSKSFNRNNIVKRGAPQQLLYGELNYDDSQDSDEFSFELELLNSQNNTTKLLEAKAQSDNEESISSEFLEAVFLENGPDSLEEELLLGATAQLYQSQIHSLQSHSSNNPTSLLNDSFNNDGPNDSQLEISQSIVAIDNLSQSANGTRIDCATQTDNIIPQESYLTKLYDKICDFIGTVVDFAKGFCVKVTDLVKGLIQPLVAPMKEVFAR
jgi:hypothetical protein